MPFIADEPVKTGGRFIPDEPTEPLMRRGGIGKPIPREEARVIAGQRMIARENAAGLNDLVDAPGGGVGVYGGTGFAKLTSGLRGAGNALTLGALDPVLAALTKKTELNRALQGVQKQDPLAQEVGSAASMLPGLTKAIPQAAVNLGKSGLTALTAKTLAKGGILGAGAGAVSGANQELGREIQQDETINPANITSSAIEAAKDPKTIALGAVLANASRNPAKVLQERQQGSAQKIYSILNLPKGSPKLNRLNKSFENGGLVETLNEIKREGTPKTAKEALEATKKAKDSNWSAVEEIVSNNPDHAIDVSGIRNSLLGKASSALTDAEATQIKNFADKFSEPLKLSDAIDMQKRLNEEWNPNSGISNAAHSEAAGQLSGLLDSTFKKLTGTDKNPYRQWGRLSELNKGFQKAYDSAFARTQKGQNAGVVSESLKGLTSGGINPINIGKKTLAPIYKAARGREIGALDREIADLFSSIEPAEPVLPTSSFAQRQRSFRPQTQGAPPINKVGNPSDIEGILQQNQQRRQAAAELERSARNRRAFEKLNAVETMRAMGRTGENERGVGPASDKDIVEYLNTERNLQALLNQQKALKPFEKEVSKQYGPAVRGAIKDIRQLDSGEVLSEIWHNRNTKNDPLLETRYANELTRRLGAKKYSKDWPEIRDALGLPEPTEGMDLPRKREMFDK